MNTFITLKTKLNTIVDGINENRWLQLFGYINGLIPLVPLLLHLISKFFPSKKLMFHISWPNEIFLIIASLVFFYCIIIIAIKNSQIRQLQKLQNNIPKKPAPIVKYGMFWDRVTKLPCCLKCKVYMNISDMSNPPNHYCPNCSYAPSSPHKNPDHQSAYAIQKIMEDYIDNLPA